MNKYSMFAIAIAAAVGSGVVANLFVSQPSAAMAEEGHQHGKGEKHKLGKKTVGGIVVSVITIGEVEAGGHVDFDIKLYDVKTEPKAVRVWIGTEDGNGSTKAEGKKEKTYTGEVQVPKPIPEGSKLWVEIETESGTEKGAWDYDKHDHAH